MPQPPTYITDQLRDDLDSLEKAITRQGTRRDGSPKPRSVKINPALRMNPLGGSYRPGGLSFGHLRSMASRSATVAAIIATRQNQIAEFARKPRHRGDSGFEIVLVDDTLEKTPEDEQNIRILEQFILHTGFDVDPDRDTFETYMRKMIRDRLTFDATCTELVYDRVGRLHSFEAVDGATIEIVTEEHYQPTTRHGYRIDQPIKWVQLIDGEVRTEYAQDELIYAVGNPQTDINSMGYGYSELEWIVDCVASEILAIQYNGNYFTQDSVPPGILSVIGNYDETAMEELQRMWNTDVKGVIGTHKPVILAMDQGEKIEWLQMKATNRDMEFHAFLDLLATFICAVFQIDPAEIARRTPSSSGGTLGDSEATKTKIDYSKDKGIKPLLNFFASYLNRHILWRINPRYKLQWLGIDEEDEREKIELINEQGKWMTAREARTMLGMDTPKGDEWKWTDCPMDPTMAQVWMAVNGIQKPMAALGPGQGAEGQGAGQKGVAGSAGKAQDKAAGKRGAGDRLAKAWGPLLLVDDTG